MAHEIPHIGRLAPINLREVWSSEPFSFTPWLAEPENLQFLADSLDLPGFELVRTEHPVDSFSADIVAKIVDTDHFVLIENQLEKTDHTHLGQILTYAPRFDARIVVWVAREFTDAHRAALDWLNRITADTYAFFGVELRAVRIGDSAPAPLFDVVSKPNDWSKITPAAAAQGSSELSEYAVSNLAFWPGLHERLVAAGGPARQSSKPLKDSNYWAPIAANGRAYISAYRSQSRRPHVGVFLGFYNKGASLAGQKLLERRAELDAAFGEPLDWAPNPQGTAFRVSAAPLYSSTNPGDWPAQYDHLMSRMLSFERVFGRPVLDALAFIDASELE